MITKTGKTGKTGKTEKRRGGIGLGPIAIERRAKNTRKRGLSLMKIGINLGIETGMRKMKRRET